MRPYAPVSFLVFLLLRPYSATVSCDVLTAGVRCEEVCIGWLCVAARHNHPGTAMHPHLCFAVFCEANSVGYWADPHSCCHDFHIH